MPLKWTSNQTQTQAKNTPFKGLDIPAVFLGALWLQLWKCSEKNLEVGECVGRLMILFNGLRPSFPHFATPANKNSEISEIFRDSIKFSAFFRDSWTLKSTHSVCFQLLLWNLLTFSLKNWENIYLKGYHMFSCLGRRAICNIFLIVQQFHFVCKLFSECVHCTTSNGIVMSLMHGSALLLAMFFLSHT